MCKAELASHKSLYRKDPSHCLSKQRFAFSHGITSLSTIPTSPTHALLARPSSISPSLHPSTPPLLHPHLHLPQIHNPSHPLKLSPTHPLSTSSSRGTNLTLKAFGCITILVGVELHSIVSSSGTLEASDVGRMWKARIRRVKIT